MPTEPNLDADELRSFVHLHWQRRLRDALARCGWQPPRYDASGGPVPWEEVAATAVEALWNDLEPLVAPVVDLVSQARLSTTSAVSVEVEPAPGVEASDLVPERVWLSADEVAPLLRTTPHSLRRLARQGQSPVVVRRIGGRWWFARIDVERFLGRRPSGVDSD